MMPESPREKTVTPCDFRASGLLSNESTRLLRSMHETFARALSHSLDLFLGSPLELKFTGIDQVGAREFTAKLSASSYLIPFALAPMQEKIVVRFESSLLFPLLDLLLGGSGEPLDSSRDLTEIDEELFRSVTELMAGQLERVWKVCQVSVAPLSSIKPASLGQLFAMEERVVLLNFQIRLPTTTAAMALVLPMSFSSALVRGSQSDSVGRSGRHADSKLGLNDRLLECDMPLAVELPGLSVPVGDLLGMQQGTVLQLGASVERPILLHVGGHALFQVSPVRRGQYKAAQLNVACRNEA